MKKSLKKTRIVTEQDIPGVARELLEMRSSCQVYAFRGPLGAGKTTLIKEMVRAAGVRDEVTSPTFVYMNRYTAADGSTVYHFDLYRLTSIDDFKMAGFDEYLYESGSWALIEWPEVIMPLLTHKVCLVDIVYYGTDRQITYEVIEGSNE